MAETLGDLLKNLGIDLPAVGPSEPIAATSAYIPGYPTHAPNSNPPVEQRAGLVAEGTDLSHGVKQKLAEYTTKVIQSEGPLGGYASPDKNYDEVGHGRQDSLRKAQIEGAHHYDPGFLNTNSKTKYAEKFGGSFTEKLNDKRERPGQATLGRHLKTLKSHASEETTFGKKQKAQATDGEMGAMTEIPKATFNLLRDNKYNPSGMTPFLKSDSSRGDNQLSKGMYSLYSGLLGASTNPDGSRPKSVTVTDLRKAALDLLHRAQSVGDDNSRIVANQIFESNSPFTGKGDTLAMIPHMTQVGAGTVPGGVDRLRIRNTAAMKSFGDLLIAGQDDLINVETFDTVLGLGGNPDEVLGSIANNAKSYGTMNSPAEPFNGVAPFGMIMPVLYAIIILGLMGMLFGAILSGFGSAAKNFSALEAENPSSLAFGLNARRGTNWGGAEIAQKFLNMYGLPSDVGLEWHSMVRGIMLFYGIDINPFQPGAAIADAFINLLMAPGYYLVISKKVLADFEQVTKAFANYTNISGGVNWITIILSSLEALASSFTFRWYIIMNSIGRIDEDGRIRRGAKAHGRSVMSLRDEKDAKIVLTPSSRNEMSRWYPSGDGGVPLSPLSARLFHAVYLAGENLNAGADSAHEQKNVPGPIQTHNYLTQEMRKYIETEIDTEYMPFSVQDLRTGEIISLPAFISQIQDDFQPEYSSTQGFGRTDPVHIYKSTKRNISLTFKLVAMNPKDHDYIWYVINRFVSMVYPQRDVGRKRFLPHKKETIEFIQPFSQVISASPVIRIRVGDVIASNASKSGFEKIFGDPKLIAASSTQAAEPDSIKARKELSQGKSALKKFAKIHRSAEHTELVKRFKNPMGDHSPASPLIYRKGCPAFITVDKKHFKLELQYGIKVTDYKIMSVPDEAASGQVQKYFYILDVGQYATDEIDAMALGGTPLLAAMRAANSFPLPPPPFGPTPKIEIIVPATQGAEFVSLPNDGAESVALEFAKELDPNMSDSSVEYVNRIVGRFKKSEDEPDEDDIKKFREKAEKDYSEMITAIQKVSTQLEASLNSDEAIANFMNPNNNILVRSMEMSSGRGLAGVITNLGLAYGDSIWGVTQDMPGGAELGRRAPKFVTITLNFSPIHDLPLGLNAKGEMFAPSHPVGGLSKPQVDLNVMTVDEKIERDRMAARRSVGALPETKNKGKLELPF